MGCAWGKVLGNGGKWETVGKCLLISLVAAWSTQYLLFIPCGCQERQRGTVKVSQLVTEWEGTQAVGSSEWSLLLCKPPAL